MDEQERRVRRMRNHAQVAALHRVPPLGIMVLLDDLIAILDELDATKTKLNRFMQWEQAAAERWHVAAQRTDGGDDA